MIQLRELSQDDFEYAITHAGINVPIEQTKAWADYQETIPGRTHWGDFAIDRDGKAIGYVSFADYETHGYHYLRSHHGPMWLIDLDEAGEAEAMEAIRDFVRHRDRRIVFVRLAIEHELAISHPTLSTFPYDTTVVIDLTGGDEAILSRMKKRGRRDVRKSLRECPATFADETERGTEDFSEYYEVMADTGVRDGFTPSPMSDYQDMLRILGPDHCRLFVGRVDGRVITWTIATISGTHAVRYYGASRSESARTLATDGLIYFECCTLGARGITDYDQMGMGSEKFPTLDTLNVFKTKFAQDGVTHVAPDRDLPIRKAFYQALTTAKGLMGGKSKNVEKAEREKKERNAERAEERAR